MINCIAKEYLAKLLATENIQIQHRSDLDTAGFDPQKRILYLPIYKDITEDAYDLLIGHECSHALHTPQKEWKSVLEEDKEKPGFKTVVNIIEDARIEKLIKAKFPGLKRSFKNGYEYLYNSNFFGTKDKNLAESHFIDRINLYFKIGYIPGVKIPLDAKEKDTIEQLDKIKTFDEVVEWSRKLYEEFKDNIPQSKDVFELIDGDGEDESDANSEDGNGQKRKGKLSAKAKAIFGKDFGSTSENESSNLNKYIDNEKKSSPRYVMLPSGKKHFNYSDYVISYKKVHASIREHYSNISRQKELGIAKNNYRKFLKENTNVISYLIKEFLIKKSASEYHRTSESKTGVLNTNKLHAYQYNDDLFLRQAVVKTGTNHGFVMFIDCSGSMDTQIADVYKQVIILSHFCKKVNIPFKVYGFRNNNRDATKKEDIWYNKDINGQETFLLDNFCLYEYLSSEMKNSEFESACVNIFSIISYYQYENSDNRTSLPKSEFLASTPLDSSVVTSVQLIKDFREKYGIEKVNVIWLTDGGSDRPRTSKDYLSTSDFAGKNCVYVNPRSYKHYVIEENDYSKVSAFDLTSLLFKYCKDEINCNIIGYYIDDSTSVLNYLIHRKLTPNEEKLYQKNKGLVFDDVGGYDEFYLTKPSKLRVKDHEVVIEKTNTVSQIAKELKKYYTNRLETRFLLSKFIEKIA